jgi:hypothetical protein
MPSLVHSRSDARSATKRAYMVLKKFWNLRDLQESERLQESEPLLRDRNALRSGYKLTRRNDDCAFLLPSERPTILLNRSIDFVPERHTGWSLHAVYAARSYAVDGALKECVRRTIKRRRLDRLLNLE